MTGNKSKLLRQTATLGIFMAMIVYVAIDAVQGPHGLLMNEMMHAKIAAMTKDLAALKAQRARLERDAELLGPKAASQTELLDEQARALLDFARPTDIVIVNGEKAR